MRILLTALLCLLLMGCGQAAPAEAPARLIPTKETENDILRCYPLDGTECRFFAVGDRLLLQTEDKLLCFSGKQLIQTAVISLEPGATMLTDGAQICCYSPESGQCLLLDENLWEQARLTLPERPGCFQGSRVYYCTAEGLTAAEFDTGLHRLLRKDHPEEWKPAAVFRDALVCSREAGSIYIGLEDGAELGSGPEYLAGEQNALALERCLYLGSSMLPLPPGWEFLAFLPGGRSALLCQTEGRIELGIYDLNTGSRTARLLTEFTRPPTQAAVLEDGRIFFRIGEECRLYQWKPEYHPTRDPRLRLCPLSTGDAPDERALEQCCQEFSHLESQYGLTLLLNTQGLRQGLGEYTVTPEHLAPVIADGLGRIAAALAQFPEGFIRQVASAPEHTYLCPVRSIQENGKELDYLSRRIGNEQFLYIAINGRSGQSVIRSLSPLMDGRILSRSDACDRWEQLNPEGFRYGSDAAADPAFFATKESVLSPSEDRAGVLLAAMEDGNRELFCSAVLQAKLRRLSTALREVYSVTGTPPWEQYLWDK